MESDTQRSREDLAIELFELKEKEAQPYLTEERKKSIRRRMAAVSFELRYQQEAP